MSGLNEFLQSFGVISCGNRKSPGRFERINPKQPGPDMKKSRPTFKRFLKICLLFSLFCCLWGEKKIRKPGKNFSEAREGLEKWVSRKFESYMMGKTGVWHLRKNLVLFGPPDMQKTQEFPGFFGAGIFFALPIWWTI
ncbi:MAG: hypothetical protein IJJ99_09045 [Oscillospiraceae bacterium]|nr:hypothetical protein [Oscillospiraceae bacterium]